MNELSPKKTLTGLISRGFSTGCLGCCGLETAEWMRNPITHTPLATSIFSRFMSKFEIVIIFSRRLRQPKLDSKFELWDDWSQIGQGLFSPNKRADGKSYGISDLWVHDKTRKWQRSSFQFGFHWLFKLFSFCLFVWRFAGEIVKKSWKLISMTIRSLPKYENRILRRLRQSEPFCSS